MHLGFLVPLKAKSASKDWNQVCQVLRRTIVSIQNQTNDSCVAVVCGHDKPAFMDEIAKATNGRFFFSTYTETPPPAGDPAIQSDYLLYEVDRCNKIQGGMEALNERFGQRITHWFSLDADDLLSHNFVETMQKHTNRDAVIVDRGYQYQESTGFLKCLDDFSEWCGSSAVLSRRICDVANASSANGEREMLYRSISHHCMRDDLIKRGFDVVVEVERLVMYVCAHGDNLSARSYHNGLLYHLKSQLKFLLRRIRHDKNIRSEFGLPD